MDSEQPVSVVLAFHGGRSNAEGMKNFSKLNDYADNAGCVVVYPEGTGPAPHLRVWNAGICCGEAVEQGVDDVGFVTALLDDLAERLKIDPARVYATGMSNGGMMSYRLAAEAPERIAAIASVGGTMGTATRHPTRPVPILHIHGTEDLFVPLEGGRGKRSPSRAEFTSVAKTLNFWREVNGCAAEAVVEELPAPVEDGTTIRREVYPSEAGAEIELYVVEGGGHTWPGQQPSLLLLGKSTRNLDANRVIGAFFERHRLH